MELSATVGVPSLRDIGDVDPFPVYERLRENRVVWDPGLNAWLVTDYALCAHVLQRERSFERADRLQPGGEEVRANTRNLAVLTGHEQQRLHKFLLSYLTAAKCREYRPNTIRPIIVDGLDKIGETHRVDLAATLADVVPSRVGLALIGFDMNDVAGAEEIRLLKAQNSRWHNTAGLVDEDTKAASAAAMRMKDLLMPLVRDRKQHPLNDITSDLWRRGPNVFPDWDEDDVYASCQNIVSGGETVYALRNIIYLLLTRKSLCGRLWQQPDLIPHFVEEVLRVYGVLHWPARVATADVELGDVAIKAGELVVPLIGMTGREPARYSHPDELDLDAEEQPAHLTFGFGPRFCIGAALARAECLEVVMQLRERFHDLSLDEDREAPQYRGLRLRSYFPLHARIELR